ncbi:hypothetical protein [Actinoplanes teichomyceticus]|uniref:Uncharacterized protein n=1 Tax=Actinoplanes teichomyceticus TaxID=1867 RepID=A0A561VCS4_ACTTI|nr:hypothetical protein [Actinoplanes teichomyceticus]TWG09415.1 hypothetical protein FHX34_108130 [Actinoplanes teichomyceticus]
MSELSTGAYPPGGVSGDGASKARQVAEQGKQVAAQAASEVTGTVAEQAHRVGAQARTQARDLAGEVRDKLGEQARSQHERLVGGIRQTADSLDEMRGDRPDSPAALVVSRVADGGRQLADYLDRHGPEGVLAEVQDFARRRPGAFLATALAAGFVVGRLGKSVAKAEPAPGAGKPASDSFTSGHAPAARPEPLHTPPVRSADYPAATGAETTVPLGGYPGADHPAATGAETTVPLGGYPGAATGVGDDYSITGREPRP